MKFATKQLRKTVLDMAYAGSTVHIPCAFSIIEIVAVLYRNFLRFEAGKHDDPSRDYLVLSKGHGVMAQYACLRELGWIAESDVKNYFKDGTSLKGLSDAKVPGIEVSGGSLGHGLSVGVGLALAAKKKKNDQKVFAIVGDGEMNEGSIWEAMLFASHFKLSNLFVIVDENGFQAMGTTEEIINLGSLEAKFNAFGFETLKIDGHDEAALKKAFDQLIHSNSDQPKAIVCKTIKGKGVSFMENDNRWHYTRLNPETYAAALAELK